MRGMRRDLVLLFLIFIIWCSVLPACGEEGKTPAIAAGVVPHHLLAKGMIEDFFSSIAKQKELPETLVLFSPDHSNCSALQERRAFISIDPDKARVRLDEIPIDVELLEKLMLENSIKEDQGAVFLEFGITNLLPYIKKYLPKTKIVPIIIPENISRYEVERLITTIVENVSDNTILAASVDFSHYLPPEAAKFHDLKSIRVLLNFEEEGFENIEVDSWQSLYAVRLFARLKGCEYPKIIGHSNSFHVLPFDKEETTSYFSVVFQERVREGDYQSETVLFAGDMMLGRGIERLRKEHGTYYPFQKIVQLLRGIDLVFANLEGPITGSVLESAKNEEKLSFSFSPEVLASINCSRINLLSLANNHITDRSKEGLAETRNWLTKYRINFIGTLPLGLGNSESGRILANNYFSTQQSIYMAYNRVLPFINFREEIIEDVRKTRKENPDKVIVVSMHWGEEYELISSPSQRELAQQVIAAGADMIIGHHPHVVQEIELIENKAVFYSLGNFIFDRQALAETKEGLLVGLSISADKLTFRLFPIENNNGQPKLMSQNSTEQFLKSLAQKSDKKIGESIKKGIIEIMR